MKVASFLLNKVFHFGPENMKKQLKNTLYISTPGEIVEFAIPFITLVNPPMIYGSITDFVRRWGGG